MLISGEKYDEYFFAVLTLFFNSRCFFKTGVQYSFDTLFHGNNQFTVLRSHTYVLVLLVVWYHSFIILFHDSCVTGSLMYLHRY